jgi:hypothetical protein
MQNTQPQILWIFGDSWSATSPTKDPDRIWTRQLAQRLSQTIGRPVQVRNHSLIGAAPDWITEQYLKNTASMGADDYVVMVLTSPYRVWYFEDIPSLTNWNIIDFDSIVSREQAQAVELYLKHIQREHIDTLHTVNRLGNIAYESASRGLRRPMLIKGFDQDLNIAESYPDICIAKGYLSAVQYNEYADLDQMDQLKDRTPAPNWFYGFDCRYNHLCLRNHDILVDKLLQGLLKDRAPDLTQGFHQHIIKENWYEDSEFCQQELHVPGIENFFKVKEQTTSSWKDRTGLSKIFG